MERQQARKDLIAMVVLLVFSLALYFLLIPNYIPQRASVSGDVVFTSRTFPSILAIILGVLSAFGTAKNGYVFFKREKTTSEKEEDDRPLLDVLRPFIVFGIIVLYGVLFTKIGMIISSIICLPLLLIAYGERKPIHYVEVGVFCSFMYLVFRFVLNIPLP